MSAIRKYKQIEGYNWRDYDPKKGINPSGEDILSNKVVDQVQDMILGGYSDMTIKDTLYDMYGMNSYCVRFITGKAHTQIQTNTEKATDNLLQKQNARLFRLYRRAVEKDDTKAALNILAEINKVNKLYTTKIEVSSDIFTLDLGLDATNIKVNEDK